MTSSFPSHRDLQRRVQALLDRLVSEGIEDAVQTAIYVGGELVVDAWACPAGWSGPVIDGTSLFPVYSTTKGIAATAVHRLVERGTLDYDTPIARFWPEFAAHGKSAITLRHALSHTAGLPHMPDSLRMTDVCDWDGICRAIAELEPLWPAGTRQAYHAITYGWIIGETAHRADGRSFQRIIQDEVCRPLGIDTLFVGISDDVAHRVVDVTAAPPPPPSASPPPPAAPDPVMERAIPPWVKPLEVLMNRADVRRACIPATNGIMNARSVAKHYASLVGNGVDGIRLLTTDRMATVTTWEIPSGPGGREAGKRGLGFGLHGPEEDPGSVFGHGGHGGSQGLGDQRFGLGFGFARSRMSNHGTAALILTEVRTALSA